MKIWVYLTYNPQRSGRQEKNISKSFEKRVYLTYNPQRSGRQEKNIFKSFEKKVWFRKKSTPIPILKLDLSFVSWYLNLVLVVHYEGVGNLKISTFCQCSWGRKCQQRWVGGQKKAKNLST